MPNRFDLCAAMLRKDFGKDWQPKYDYKLEASQAMQGNRPIDPEARPALLLRSWASFQAPSQTRMMSHGE